MSALGDMQPTTALSGRWEECSLADSLVASWPTTLGVSQWGGKLIGHPVPWRLWARFPSHPKAPPIVVTRSLDDVRGERCVALTDVEASLVFAALDEGAMTQERFVELVRARQVAMGEQRVRPLRWLDVCELAGVDPWRVVARELEKGRTSLGVALARLGLEAVRLEVRS